MSGDFLAENNQCGQTLLRLVARGNAIIAELTSSIFDFSYLSNQVYYDTLIQSKQELQTLDDEFKFNHLDMLTRFYLVFESIHKYVMDLIRFLEDLVGYARFCKLYS